MRSAAVLCLAVAACDPRTTAVRSATDTVVSATAAPPIVVGSTVGTLLPGDTVPVVTPALRTLCDSILVLARHRPSHDSVGALPDTFLTVPADEDHERYAACGAIIRGGRDSTGKAEAWAAIPGTDLGHDYRFEADGALGGTTATRRPGAVCVVDEQWDGEDTPDGVALGDSFHVTVHCFSEAHAPPDEGPPMDPQFDPVHGGYDTPDSACFPYPAYTVLVRPLPGVRAARIVVRATSATPCDTADGRGNYEVPGALLPRLLGVRDSVLFLQSGVTRDAPSVVFMDLADHHLIYEGRAVALEGMAPTGQIGVYRPAALSAPDPRCQRGRPLARVDSLFWVDIHTGAERFSHRTHCPSYE